VDAALHHGIGPKSLLNVNLPWRQGEPYQGVRVTKLGQRVYQDSLIEKKDPRGRPYYWIGGDEPVWVKEDDTDFLAVSEGFVSVTPLMLDLTHHRARAEMEKWRLAP
jgi:5'-nucleotidase